MSRLLGAKSPVTHTYAQDVATLGDVMLTLNKVRAETGNKPEDYFIPRKVPVIEAPKDELSTETSVVDESAK